MVFSQYRIVWHRRNDTASEESAGIKRTAAETVPPFQDSLSGRTAALSVQGSAAAVPDAGSTSDKTPLWSQWLKLPYSLRVRKADVFIEMRSKVDYLPSLVNFLKSRNLSVLPYDDTKHYLPYDVLLLCEGQVYYAGRVVYLEEGKRKVWDFLKRCFPDRL